MKHLDGHWLPNETFGWFSTKLRSGDRSWTRLEAMFFLYESSDDLEYLYWLGVKSVVAAQEYFRDTSLLSLIGLDVRITRVPRDNDTRKNA